MTLLKFKFRLFDYRISILLNFIPSLWMVRFYRARVLITGDKMINIMFLGTQFRLMWYRKRKTFKTKNNGN